MSLLQQIIDEAVSASTDVSRLLRLCQVLGARLQHEQLGNWVCHELNGYGQQDTLPNYRILPVHNQGNFVGLGFRGVLEVPVSVLPIEVRPHYTHAKLRQSVSEYVDLVKRSADGSLKIPWPVTAAVKYASKVVRDGQCISAWSEISPSAVTSMLDQIKTRILAFALAIERHAPDAGSAVDAPGLPAEQVTQFFVNNIYGSQIDVLQAGPEATAHIKEDSQTNE